MFRKQPTVWYAYRDLQDSSKGLQPEHGLLALDDVDVWLMLDRKNNLGLQFVGFGALHQKCTWVPSLGHNYISYLGCAFEIYKTASQSLDGHEWSVRIDSRSLIHQILNNIQRIQHDHRRAQHGKIRDSTWKMTSKLIFDLGSLSWTLTVLLGPGLINRPFILLWYLEHIPNQR